MPHNMHWILLSAVTHIQSSAQGALTEPSLRRSGRSCRGIRKYHLEVHWRSRAHSNSNVGLLLCCEWWRRLPIFAHGIPVLVASVILLSPPHPLLHARCKVGATRSRSLACAPGIREDALVNRFARWRSCQHCHKGPRAAELSINAQGPAHRQQTTVPANAAKATTMKLAH